MPDGSKVTLVERPWVGMTWRNPYNTTIRAEYRDPRKRKRGVEIENGALWPLVGKVLRVYKCPVGRLYESVNYAIVDAMNGMHRIGTVTSSTSYGTVVGVRVDRTTLWIKKMSEIDLPTPAERMVFIDEGTLTPRQLYARALRHAFLVG